MNHQVHRPYTNIIIVVDPTHFLIVYHLLDRPIETVSRFEPTGSHFSHLFIYYHFFGVSLVVVATVYSFLILLFFFFMITVLFILYAHNKNT